MKHYRLFVISISFLIAACSSSTLENTNIGGTRFYTLNSLAPSNNSNSNLSIGVGPIEIPQLINRPQIISRKNETEIIMSETHQWGGSHREELIQTISDNLSSILKTDNVEQYPWKLTFKPNYQIRINLIRLDGELGKSITLKARWRAIKNNKEILVKVVVFEANIHGSSYSDYVKSESQVLKLLSMHIAKQLLQITKQ